MRDGQRDAGGQQDQGINRGDTQGLHWGELVRTCGNFLAETNIFRAQRASAGPSSLEAFPQYCVGVTLAQPGHRQHAHVEQGAEEGGEEHHFGENEPAHAPAEGTIHLLIVFARLGLGDDSAKPAEHHVKQHQQTGQDNPAARDAMWFDHITKPLVNRGHPRPN